nr:YhgE/Pip family protein [Corynebacterium sp. TAE3-ERU12]
MGGPVGVHENNTAGDNTFGAGLAPVFFSMALHVGGLVIFLVLRPLQQRQIGSGVSPLRAAVDGFIPGGIISFFQALCVVGVTMAVTPLRPASITGVVLFAVLVALMYGAINQMLHALLGPGPGRVTSLSLLMVQMVSSGGMYPVETQPFLLSLLHPFMPMTYAVNGFRQVMYGTYDERLVIAVVAILVWIAVAMALTAVAAARDRTWSMSRLHPPIDV